jgi:hypothetical protein
MAATDSKALDFIVLRSDLRTCKFLPAAGPEETELQPGQVLLEIDKFAFTSNNITYATFGDSMSYWNFFPAPEGWGRIPVWGFADVIRSQNEAIQCGERFYGYFPMSSHVVVQAERTSNGGFFDGAPQRKPLHALYNQYWRTTTDPAYEAAREDQQMLLRPLFITSFLIDDFLADNAFFDAQAVLLSSASSKTAYGLAFLLSRRKQCQVIALTSPSNAAFVARLGCYDRVLTYQEIASLPSEMPVVYVDLAGNGKVRSALHHHFRDHVKYSCAVGVTHWDQFQASMELPGARPIFFFAPAQIKKRSADWGPGGFQERFAAAWRQFMEPVSGWMRVIHGRGPADVERVYLEMVDGHAKPDEGQVLSLRNL